MSEKKQGLIPADHLSGDAEQPGGGGASKAEWDGKRWSVSGAPKAKPARWQQEMIPVGVCYAGCMFVCGNVLIGIGDALVELAHTVKMPPEDTGGLFLMRGVGQILATLFCADIYSTYHGNGILAACCIVVAVLWVLGAMITNVWVLYLWFFGTGLMTATLDIGTQILTRRAYGAKAGPWLTANTFCFATAGLLAPLVDYATKSLLQQCTVYGAVAAALALLTFVVSEECYVFPTKMPTDADAPPEVKSLGEKVKTSLFSWLDPVYRNDAVLALMIFFVIGGQNMMSNYLETFILITGVTEVSVDSGLLSLFWGSMVISRLVAMFKLQPGLTTKPLIRQMYIMFLGCMIAAVPLWLAPNMMGQPDLTSACDSTSDSDQISLSPASLCFTAGVPVPVQCPMAKVGDLYFNCSAGHSELDKNKVSGFRVVPGRKGGQPCWRGDPDAKKGDADHTYTWMCGTKDIGGKTLSPHDEGNHPSWPLFVGYLTYGFFVGPILGYIFDFHNRVTVSKERGSAILILGLNLGSSLVPFMFTACLQLGLQGTSMPVVEMFSILAPAGLMWYLVGKNKHVVNGTDDDDTKPAPVQMEDMNMEGGAPGSTFSEDGSGGSIYGSKDDAQIS